jgi:hypothetical protein
MDKKSKIYLGHSEQYGAVYLSRHSWDCNWYYGLGYLGNKNCHYHFESYLDGKHWKIEDVFTKTWLNQSQWWILLDMFKQAYALKHCAEVYRYGGHISSKSSVTDIIQSADKAAIINDDLR